MSYTLNTMMKMIYLTLLFLIGSTTSFAQETLSVKNYLRGGGTSGGGDILGISALSVFKIVVDKIETVGTNLYPANSLESLDLIKSKIKIIMTSESISLDIKDQKQDSDAFSISNENINYIFINEESWKNIIDPIELEYLIHHEIMVLLGLESTGNYHYTNEFKKFRAEFWRFVRTHNNICSIQIFEKQTGAYEKSPGKLVGSSATTISFSGAKADMGELAELENNKYLIWRGVIDNLGYFRMQIDTASLIKRTKMFDLSNTKNVESMRIYSNPYTTAGLEKMPVVKGEKYWIMVNCNRF